MSAATSSATRSRRSKLAGMATSLAVLADVLASRPPARIAGVLRTMRAIERALPPEDGVAAFTRLYRAVTEAVAEAADGAAFEDEATLRWLDVVFANLYFDALRRAATGRAVPSAWRPLVARHSDRRIHPLQFALAGMNAHINRDLPVALVTTCEARGLDLRARTPQQRDYRAVNRLLRETEASVKGDFLRGPVALADEALGRLDDVVAMWNVERAREAAWVNAETLWALRPLRRLSGEFVRSLDRLVGLAGRGLLRPVQW